MPPTIRPRPYPFIAVVVAIALSGVVVASAVLGAGFRPESPEGAVAALTSRPSLPTPSPTARPTPTPTAVPTPTPSPTPRQPIPEFEPLPTPTPDPVLAMNLFRKGDFVSQATKDQCVSAAMQIMLNIMGPKDDRSTRTQARLDALAEELTATRKGATEPKGWAAGLEQLGAGGYRIEVAPSRTKAILRAATAMRRTGRPVGLLVWRGAHSWVMHGYESTADPLAGVPFEVTHLYVTDPWYPRISSIWGASRGPNARITPKQLEEDYLPWRRPTGRYPGMDGQYVLILPEN